MCAASAAAVADGTLLAFDAQDIDRRVLAGRARWPKDAQGDGECAARVAAPSHATACRSRRSVVLHPPMAPRGRRVLVNGRRVRSRRVGRTALRISFAGRPGGTVRVVVRGARGRVDRRTYHLCRA
jgi:hypothetical protein